MTTTPTFSKILFWLASACFATGATVSASNYDPYTFSTLAGSAGFGNADGTGSAARFNNPFGVAVDSAGNGYVADTTNHTIRKITPAGVVTTLAGLAGSSGGADGTGSAARFNLPKGVAVDSTGNVYVADTNNYTIRKITPAGVVSTLAGVARSAGSEDGTGSEARFFNPSALTVDNAGNLYVADTGGNMIRKITPAGVVTTFAGQANAFGSNDGTGTNAHFFFPSGITVDSAGTIYVADSANNTIRKITPAAVVTTIAGQVKTPGSADGIGTAATFSNPTSVAVDSAGNVYVADRENSTIRKITPAAVVSTFAGLAGSDGYADGTGSAARFFDASGVTVDSAGNIYVADTSNNAIRKITPAAVVSTFAGLPGGGGSADGTGSSARFLSPSGVTVDSTRNVYVADTSNHTIRKITPAGVVTTLAGQAGAIGSADGTGSAARFFFPQGVAVDNAGNVYVADTGSSTIRKITPAGVVTTLAGQPFNPGSADGTGGAALFDNPIGIAVDSTGDQTFKAVLYVADSHNNTIRRVTLGGEVTTFAGQAGTVGSTAGTGSAARFNNPNGVTADTAGNVYVADTGNHLIRKITPAAAVTTLAGLANTAGSADGTGTAATFNQPMGVAVDSAGNVFVADRNSSTIRKITPAGLVSTLAGLAANTTGSNDGTGIAARFNKPRGLCVDSAGYVYVADSFNNTIRIGTAVASQPLNISTRMEVLSGNNVLIAGIIVTGPAGSTKTVAIRSLGPSLANFGIANSLSDPLLELHEQDGTVITNDNWQDASNSANIPVSLRPSDPKESVILATLPIGSSGVTSFTAIVRGAHGETGIGLVEAYDLDQDHSSRFANVSTRGFVDTGNNAMIGGFILGASNQGSTIVVRAIGPSLTNFGIANALPNPGLELHDGNGAKIKTNYDWQTDEATGQSQEAAIVATTLQPSNPVEAAILATLAPGAYTAVVLGEDNSTGVGLVEVYNLH